jgi:hypothetical protein
VEAGAGVDAGARLVARLGVEEGVGSGARISSGGGSTFTTAGFNESKLD